MLHRITAFMVFGCACSRTELYAPTPADGAVDECPIVFLSGASWTVERTDTHVDLGAAQPVCLNSTVPSDCPSDGVDYGWSEAGWGANISTLGGALWIWRTGVSRTDKDGATQFAFTRTFVIPGSATGKLTIAADDFAEIEVNGAIVGSVGSLTDGATALAAQNALTTFDLSPRLVSGPNTIRDIAQNGPFVSCAGGCDYQQNPAAVVFGGSIDCH